MNKEMKEGIVQHDCGGGFCFLATWQWRYVIREILVKLGFAILSIFQTNMLSQSYNIDQWK